MRKATFSFYRISFLILLIHYSKTRCTWQGGASPQKAATKRHLRSSSVSLDQVGVTHVMNYHTLLHSRKFSYSANNLHRYAISMTLANVDGTPIGSHPLVTCLVKGVFTKRPPSRKVPSVWDPASVMNIFMH
jgi:hypothetical protein